jgi:hypothetical protein
MQTLKNLDVALPLSSFNALFSDFDQVLFKFFGILAPVMLK